MQSRHFAFALALPCTLMAQASFSPAAAATGLGNVNNTLPFAQTSYQYQQVHNATSFNVPIAGLVNRMRFRPKAATAGGIADMEMFMALSPKSANTASSTFAGNETASSLVNVFVRKNYNMPIVGANIWGGPDITFDAPFALPPSLDMSWRVVIYSNTTPSTGNTLDCYSDWRFGLSSPFTGCAHPLGTRAAVHNSTYRSPGQPWDLNGYSYLPNVAIPAALFIGDSSGTWGSIPLPYDMGAIGAPGCSIVNNPVAILPGVTLANPTGFLGFSVPTPENPVLVGASLFTQFIFVEAGANALGAFTSNGRVNSPIPGPIEVTRIYASGTTATSGSVGPQFAVPIALN